jgi:prepilin-type N-terminal cleavage/methylation domain-containing protein
MPFMMYRKKVLSGFTLMECLVSLFLSAMVLTGALKLLSIVLTQQKNMNDMQNRQYRTQFAYLFFKNLLTFDKRCMSNAKNATSIVLSPPLSLNSIKDDTDMLYIKHCTIHQGFPRWKDSVFFIRHTHRYTVSHQPIFSLYQKIIGNPSEELIEGVSQMKVCYIVVNSQQRLECLSAEKIRPWASIQGLKIELLLDAITPLSFGYTQHTVKDSPEKAQNNRLHSKLFIILPIAQLHET